MNGKTLREYGVRNVEELYRRVACARCQDSTTRFSYIDHPASLAAGAPIRVDGPCPSCTPPPPPERRSAVFTRHEGGRCVHGPYHPADLECSP